MNRKLLIVFVLVFSFCGIHLYGEMMVLRNNQGVEIKAEIVAVRDQEVEILREDGLRFTFQKSMLDVASIRIIEQWELENLSVGALNVSIREKNVGRDRTEDDVYKRKIEEIKIIFNIQSDLDLFLDNLRLEYRIYYADERVGAPVDNYRYENIIRGTKILPEIKKGKGLQIASNETITLEETRVKGSFTIINGFNGPAEDEIIGTWGRIYAGDRMIHEFAKPESIIDKKIWD